MTPSPETFSAVTEEVAKVKEVAYAAREILIELAGRSGKNGDVGKMRKDIAEIRAEQKSQRQLIIRLMLAVAGAAMGGAGIGHAVLQAF